MLQEGISPTPEIGGDVLMLQTDIYAIPEKGVIFDATKTTFTQFSREEAMF